MLVDVWYEENLGVWIARLEGAEVAFISEYGREDAVDTAIHMTVWYERAEKFRDLLFWPKKTFWLLRSRIRRALGLPAWKQHF